jgi:tetratricopeptide (TPR) repeat protein
MKCSKCRNPLSEEAKFCPECGHKVSHVNKSSTKTTNDPSDKTPTFSKPLHAFSLIIGAVAIALLIVFLIMISNREQIEEKKKISSNTEDLPAEVKVQLEELSANPQSISLNIEMGNTLFDLNRFNEAITFYQRALSLDSSNIEVQIDLAVCFFNLRKIDQALLEMEKALKIDPNHPKGLFNIGIIYYNLGKFDQVRKYWERLTAVHPQGMEARKAQELLENLN